MSGTVRSFQAMLNQYLPNDLLKEEFIKRDWMLQNIEMDNSWKGGTLIVLFKGQQASSVAFGGLTASSDIAQDAFVRGQVSTQPEVWGSMIFNHRDLMEHDKISEQNFLKLLPDTVDDFLDYMKMAVSLSFMNGPAICPLVLSASGADATSAGVCTVFRPERLVLGQKVFFYNATTGLSVATYISVIDMNLGTVTVVSTRGGSTAVDISAYTVANTSKLYYDGSQTSPLTDLKSSLLSASNTGSSGAGGTTLYGQTKTAYPYLQAIQVDGSSSGLNVTSTTFLQNLFDSFVTIKNRGKGMPNKAVMSYRNFGYAMSILEAQKGAYHIDQTSRKVNSYGWEEVRLYGPKGSLDLVAIQEMDDDCVFFLDVRPSVMKIYSNGGFRKRVSPNGLEYFEVRNTTGYQYIIDSCFFGDFVLLRPSYCGVLCNIP